MSFARSLKEQSLEVWEAGYAHPFVQGLGAGTLERDRFQFYLLQDYRYLIQYAKVFALAATMTDDEDLLVRITKLQHSILADEMDMHRQYMADYGVSRAQMDAVRPSLFNRSYTANMFAAGNGGGLAGVLATVLPCGQTYSDYASRLAVQYADNLTENPYRSWIEMYSGSEFEASYDWIFDAIDGLVAGASEQRRKEVADIFAASVEFEYLFWDMSYKQQMSFDQEIPV